MSYEVKVEEAVGVAGLISRVAAVTQSHTNGMLIEINRLSRGKIMTLRG